jgi:hypothetical protein
MRLSETPCKHFLQPVAELLADNQQIKWSLVEARAITV